MLQLLQMLFNVAIKIWIKWKMEYDDGTMKALLFYLFCYLNSRNNKFHRMLK